MSEMDLSLHTEFGRWGILKDPFGFLDTCQHNIIELITFVFQEIACRHEDDAWVSRDAWLRNPNLFRAYDFIRRKIRFFDQFYELSKVFIGSIFLGCIHVCLFFLWLVFLYRTIEPPHARGGHALVLRALVRMSYCFSGEHCVEVLALVFLPAFLFDQTGDYGSG